MLFNMGQVIRVSLPGYDALTDTNPDHFALYSDEDWVLIKESARGSISATSTGSDPIYFGFSYIPTVFVYYQDGSIWRTVTGQYYDFETESKLPYVGIIEGGMQLFGNSGTPTNFKFFICYDNNDV